MHQIVTESLPTSRAAIAARIEQVRARTLALVEGLSEDALNRVHDPLMSPIVWDLGHVATFEDLWLAQKAFGVAPLREGTLALLEDADLSPDAGPLLGDGFVYELVLRHEQQHSETILQAIQLSGQAYRPDRVYATPGAPSRRPGEMLVVPGGTFDVGAEAALGANGFAYDNERPRHELDVA